MQAILILSWHHIFIMDMLNMDRLHMCIYVYMLSHFSHVWLFVTPWSIIHQAPLSMGILQVRILEWVAMPSSRGSSQPRDQTSACLLHPALAGRFFITSTTWETHGLIQFSSVQSLSHVRLPATAWTAGCQAFLSITTSWSLLKPMST